MSGSCKLSERQIIILRLIAKAARKGWIWIPNSVEKLDDQDIYIGGGGDAGVVKSLWRRGLASKVDDVGSLYSSEMTQEGWEWIKVLEKEEER